LVHEPLFFDRSRASRFNAPGREFGVVYVGDGPACAFIETFDRSAGERVVTRAALAQRGIVSVAPTRPLRLADLTGPGLARLGADARLSAGEDYALAQRWSHAIWQHPAQPDGIVYRSRHDPSLTCAALYDRVAPAVQVTTDIPLTDAAWVTVLASLLERYSFGLIDDPEV
jgi:hypothetical protein